MLYKCTYCVFTLYGRYEDVAIIRLVDADWNSKLWLSVDSCTMCNFMATNLFSIKNTEETAIYVTGKDVDWPQSWVITRSNKELCQQRDWYFAEKVPPTYPFYFLCWSRLSLVKAIANQIITSPSYTNAWMSVRWTHELWSCQCLWWSTCTSLDFKGAGRHFPCKVLRVHAVASLGEGFQWFIDRCTLLNSCW